MEYKSHFPTVLKLMYHCGGVTENSPHRLIGLNTQSPAWVGRVRRCGRVGGRGSPGAGFTLSESPGRSQVVSQAVSYQLLFQGHTCLPPFPPIMMVMEFNYETLSPK